MEYHDLENMTVIKLRDEAKKIPDVKGLTGMKKDELIALLVDHLGIEVPEKQARPKKPVPSAPKTKESLKQKINELKGERDAARGAGDRKKSNVIRKRIHMLKRQLRKLA
jgi:hypothetical protein